MIRILVVEDQYFARVALHTVIDSRSDMRITAETMRGDEALRAFRKSEPDVVIMDLRLPGASGFDAIRSIRGETPDARIVVLSNYEGSEDVHRALDAGALAYLTKDSSDDELIAAILAVHRGKRFLPGNVKTLLDQRGFGNELTAREAEVLELLAEGCSNQEIADRLQIAEKTTRTHMTHIFDKLGVTDRTQAVITAHQRGLVHLDPKRGK
jgi:DNA-binding NarL/FixJ family response regulator